ERRCATAITVPFSDSPLKWAELSLAGDFGYGWAFVNALLRMVSEGVPGRPNDNKSPPAAITTNCFPPDMYVTGAPAILPPVSKCHNRLPVCDSRAKKLL